MIRFFLWHNIFREKTGGSFTTRCSAIFRRCSFFYIYGYLNFYHLYHPYFCSKKDIPAKHTLSRRYVWKQSHLPYPLPLPAARPHAFGLIFSIPKSIACSVCTVDLASCSNVMQCKENFYSLTGLPLNFSERIHHEPYVSQAKVFYFTGRYLQLSFYSMSGNMLRTAQFYIK